MKVGGMNIYVRGVNWMRLGFKPKLHTENQIQAKASKSKHKTLSNMKNEHFTTVFMFPCSHTLTSNVHRKLWTNKMNLNQCLIIITKILFQFELIIDRVAKSNTEINSQSNSILHAELKRIGDETKNGLFKGVAAIIEARHRRITYRIEILTRWLSSESHVLNSSISLCSSSISLLQPSSLQLLGLIVAWMNESRENHKKAFFLELERE